MEPDAAASANCLTAPLAQQYDEACTLCNQIGDWLFVHAPSFFANLLTVAVILLVGWFAINRLSKLVRLLCERRAQKDSLVPRLVASTVNKTLWALLLMVVVQRLGINLAPVIAGLGVTGFIVGFACQESLSNLAAGVMIAINRPFKVGDYCEMGGIAGAVSELNMMATTLTTPDNKVIIVPNKTVWGSAITNYSAKETRRVDLTVGIAYGSDIPKAIQIIRDTLLADPRVLKDPAPLVAATSFGDSAVNLTIRPWVKSADYWDVYFAQMNAVKAALDSNGIEIPFPQVDLHIKDQPRA